MKTLDILVQLIVIGGFILYSYSKIKGQSVRDTFEEIRGLIEKFKDGY